MSTVTYALRKALKDVSLEPQDQAAARLALEYAAQIDGGQVAIEKVGPALLSALESLGMTPRARKGIVKGGDGERPASPLDEVRRKREQRTG